MLMLFCESFFMTCAEAETPVRPLLAVAVFFSGDRVGSCRPQASSVNVLTPGRQFSLADVANSHASKVREDQFIG